MKRAFSIGLIALFLVVAAAVLYKITQVNKIYCKSQYGACTSEVEEMVKSVEGTNYFVAKTKLGELLAGTDKVEDYEMKFQLPPSFVVNVIEKKAIIAIKREVSENYDLYNSSGEKVGESSTTELPVIELTYDEQDSEVINFTIDLVSSLYQYYDVQRSILFEDGIKVELKKGITMLFSKKGDVDVSLGSVEALLFRLNQLTQNSKISGETRNYSEIDFRYENPVIR